MNGQNREIAHRYLLPERPFLYGMASAFDLFGVLNRGKLENVRDRVGTKSRQSDVESLRSVWREVGDTLLFAIDQYERELSESGTD